jgi:hypothetical protein
LWRIDEACVDTIKRSKYHDDVVYPFESCYFQLERLMDRWVRLYPPSGISQRTATSQGGSKISSGPKYTRL